MTKIAVYGTLKGGQYNHYLLNGSKYLGSDFIVGVAVTSGGGFPYAVKEDGYATYVEVYDVDDVILDRVDRLEGHPDWYKREEVDSKHGKVWMYLNEEAKTMEYEEMGVWGESGSPLTNTMATKI